MYKLYYKWCIVDAHSLALNDTQSYILYYICPNDFNSNYIQSNICATWPFREMELQTRNITKLTSEGEVLFVVEFDMLHTPTFRSTQNSTMLIENPHNTYSVL